MVTILIIAATVPLMACTGKGGNPQPIATPTATVSPTTAIPMDEWTDTDGDGISNYLEVNTYHTDPLKADTDGDGINDYNELFIYPSYLDPLNASDAQAFISMLPNVTANYVTWETGGQTNNNFLKMMNYSRNDPMVKWAANHTTIVWNDSERTYGKLELNGGSFSQGGIKYNYFPPDTLVPPAWYLTHGRQGSCGITADAIFAVMTLKNYECREIYGKLGGDDHGWVEIKIDGVIYMSPCNGLNYMNPGGGWVTELFPVDAFYSAHPEFVIIRREVTENPYINTPW